MSVIRSPEFYDYQIFNREEALLEGLEKAVILGNIDRYPNDAKKDLFAHFLYIEKERFYVLLEELIKDGYLMEVGGDHE